MNPVRMMHVLVVAGARPNFMKVAPILRALREQGHDGILVHTGQHYDAKMSDAFFQDLDLPEPDHHLGIGSGSHAVQTARVMEAFEPVLIQERPDWVVVVGDVNSTIACALVTRKLREELGCRLAHVEAGLRSHDWRMPEEVNRVLTDRLSDLLLTPSEDALPNLLAEGLPAERVKFVGNVMIDTLQYSLPRARALEVPGRFQAKPKGYAVATLHRPSNVDAAEPLSVILRGLGTVAETMPVILPLHPRTAGKVKEFGLERLLEPLTITGPLGYLEMLGLMADAAVVLTDSGGIQEETTALGVRCLTLREQTERPITVELGTNQMTEWPVTEAGLVRQFQETVAQAAAVAGKIPGWDGRAGERIVKSLAAEMPVFPTLEGVPS